MGDHAPAQRIVVLRAATAAGMGHLIVLDDNPAELALSQYSVQRWRDWAREMPDDCAYRQNGTLWLAANAEGSKANLFCTLPAQNGDTQGGIALSGHTDVVPVDGQDWASDPFVLTDKGDAFLYDNSGKPVRKSHLPSMVGYVGKSRASFFWQGEWYIFTQEETFAMNLKTGIFHKPAIQIPNAMSKTFLKSYEFLYDKKGNAYLFSKNGKLYLKSIKNPMQI